MRAGTVLQATDVPTITLAACLSRRCQSCSYDATRDLRGGFAQSESLLDVSMLWDYRNGALRTTANGVSLMCRQVSKARLSRTRKNCDASVRVLWHRRNRTDYA